MCSGGARVAVFRRQPTTSQLRRKGPPSSKAAAKLLGAARSCCKAAASGQNRRFRSCSRALPVPSQTDGSTLVSRARSTSADSSVGARHHVRRLGRGPPRVHDGCRHVCEGCGQLWRSRRARERRAADDVGRGVGGGAKEVLLGFEASAERVLGYFVARLGRGLRSLQLKRSKGGERMMFTYRVCEAWTCTSDVLATDRLR